MGWDDLHAAAMADLSAWQPDSDDQQRLRDDYLVHLAQHPDGHRKQGPPEHLTASCLVINAVGTEVLLTHHRKANAWFQFGGHLEVDDTNLRSAALREATEESGLDGLEILGGILELDRHDLVGTFGHCRQHLDVRFLAVGPEGATPRVSEESLDVAWWPIDDLPNPDLEHLIVRALERLHTSR